MSREAIASLKQKITLAKERKNDGGFENIPKVEFSIKETKVLRGHFGKVYSMDWSGKSKDLIVSASCDGKLIIWNPLTTYKLHAIPLRSSWVMTCAFEKIENELVACGGLNNICSIYKITSDNSVVYRPTRELAGHQGYLSCCRFINKEKIITSSGDSTCNYWDIETASLVTHFSDHQGDVMFLSKSPIDDNLFVSGSCDRTTRLWDLRLNSCVMIYEGHESDINSVAFFPDGKAFGTASDDSSLRLFDLRSYQQLNQYVDQSIVCGITSIAFSRSGRILFGGYDDYNTIAWDTISNVSTPLLYLKKQENRVSCLGVEEKGQALCTGNWDNLLKIWC